MAPDPIGKFADHPNIRGLALESLLRESAHQQHWANLQLHDITVVQQRTFFDLPDRAAIDEESATVSVSTALLFVDHSFGRDAILAQFSRRNRNLDWRWEGCMAKPFDPTLTAPYIPLSTVDVRGLNLGFFLLNSEINSFRVEFADGSVMEDTASDDTILLFVPYRSDAIWADLAIGRMYDQTGREFLNGKVWVSPYPDPSQFQDRESRNV